MWSSTDPLRVIVDQGGSPLSEWGPLVGVVAGAVLGGLAQVLAGFLQRRHDRAMEEGRVRRDLYGRILTAVERLDDAVLDLSMALLDDDRKRARAESDAMAAAANEISAMSSAVAISGTQDVWRALGDLHGAFSVTFGRADPSKDPKVLDDCHKVIRDYRPTLIAAMRSDLRTSGRFDALTPIEGSSE